MDIRLVMTTSPAPWHPSHTVIKTAIGSHAAMLGRHTVRLHVGADGIPPYCEDAIAEKYREYERLFWPHAFMHGVVDYAYYSSEAWIGHAGALSACFGDRKVAERIIVATEDDWFVEHETIPTREILAVLLDKSNPIECIRLPHKPPSKWGSWNVIEDLGTHYGGIPLLANRGWSTSTHFATAEFYRRRVLPALDFALSASGDGRDGVERGIQSKYVSDCKKLGERQAWEHWGVCMYWDGETRLRHLGNARSEWRRKRMVETTPTDHVCEECGRPVTQQRGKWEHVDGFRYKHDIKPVTKCETSSAL